MKHAYVYCRVSSEEQVTNYSLANQSDYCSKWAASNNYDVSGFYREEGVSAKTLNRPQLLKLLEDCRKNKKDLDAVLIYKIDRISRDTYDYLAVKKQLSEYGIRIISVTEPTEESPAGEFLETVLAAAARLDNAQKSLRTVDGLRKRVEDGWSLGKAPPGYINITQDEKQIIVPDPELFEKVKKTWEEMATGIYSLRSIVPVFNKLGITINYGSRKIPITRQQQTWRIFRDKFYCGYVVSKKFSVDKIGRHQPMITEDIFYRVQKIIDGRSFTGGISYIKQNPDFSLRGQVIYAECGNKMTGYWSHGRNARYAYYGCQCGKCKPHCYSRDDREETDGFETSYLKFMAQFQPKRKFVGLFTEMVKERWQARRSLSSSRQAEVEKEIENLKSVRANLIRKNAEGVYGDDVLKEALTGIENELIIKNIVKNEAKMEQIDIDVVVNFMNNYLWDLPKAWKEGQLFQKKKLSGSIFPKNVVFDGKEFRTAEIGLAYERMNQLAATPVSSWVMYGSRTR